MRIIYLKKSYFYKAAIAVIAIVCIAILLTQIFSTSISVFSTNYDLPIYSVDCEDKKAAITFDCAWGADDIPEILAILEKEDIKVTFFIVGQWAEKYSDAVKLIAEKGHDIANHSYSHLRMSALNRDRLNSEIQKCSSKLTEITGKKVDLFRPPYGDYSKNVTKIAGEMGYYTIQWDVDSLDWKKDIDRQTIKDRVINKVKSGSIILFHNDTQHTAKVLPDIILSLKDKGYQLVPVSELILRDNYEIDHTGLQKKKK